MDWLIVVIMTTLHVVMIFFKPIGLFFEIAFKFADLDNEESKNCNYYQDQLS